MNLHQNMTSVINFKTDLKIKTKAQKIAENMGLNLSDVLNVYLRSFIIKKELYINLNEDESHPSKELIAAAKEAHQEYKKGKLKGFKNLDKLAIYLSKI